MNIRAIANAANGDTHVAGVESQRIQLTGANDDTNAAAFRQENAKVGWLDYTDITLTGPNLSRGIYAMAGGTVVLNHVCVNNAVVGSNPVLVIAENNGTLYSNDSVLLLHGNTAGAQGLLSYPRYPSIAPSRLHAINTRVSSLNDGAINAFVVFGSDMFLNNGTMFSQGNRAIAVQAQLYSSAANPNVLSRANSNVYANGVNIAVGVKLIDQQATPTSPILTCADSATYGMPVNTGGSIAASAAEYQSSGATNTVAVKANYTDYLTPTDSFYSKVFVDRDISNVPTTITVMGAGQNVGLLATEKGIIASRGAVITVTAPNSQGARVDQTGVLVPSDNTITTTAASAYGIQVQGTGRMLGSADTQAIAAGNSNFGVIDIGALPNTITTLGANSHAIRADSGASVAFTQNLPLPSAASKVSGAGAAVLSASGVGTTLLIQSASNSLAMSMTGDTTGTTNFGALVDSSAVLTFADGAGSGGTALQAAADGTLVFSGASTNAAGSRVLLTPGRLDITASTSAVPIGSLEGTGPSLLGASELVVGVNNAGGNGSLQTATTYPGALSGAGGRLTKDGAATSLTLSGTSNSYTGATTVKAGSLIAGVVNTFSSASNHATQGTGVLDLNGFDQTVASLDNAGTTKLLMNGSTLLSARATGLKSSTSTVPGTKLTTTGNYTSNGGKLVLGTTLGDGSSPSDQLVVQGNLVMGSAPTVIQVSNVAGAGAITNEPGIPIVLVTGASPAGAFVLENTVATAGSYQYALVQVGQNWYLQSKLVPVPPPPPPPPPPPAPGPGPGPGTTPTPVPTLESAATLGMLSVMLGAVAALTGRRRRTARAEKAPRAPSPDQDHDQ